MHFAFALAQRIIQVQHRREEGQTLVEYALIIALVSIALIAALTLLATDIGNVFAQIEAQL